MGLCGAAQRQDAAGVGLLENGVAAVPAFAGGYLPAQDGCVPQHGSDAQLGILLRVNGGGVDEQDRAGVLVNDVPDDVVLQLGFSYLRGGDQDQPPDLRVGEGVHNLPEVGRPGDPVLTNLRAALRRQPALFIGPFRNGQVFRRAHPRHHLGEQFVQPLHR